MLNILLGRARTGKTAYIMDDIKRRMNEGESGMLLIVPEQYSHDAERKLCAVCGDALTLHAETLSFTRLCSNVLSEAGRTRLRSLDGSGQILAMHRALESVAPRLKVFGIKKMRTEVLERLLDAIKEFKSLNITPQALERAAERASNPLADKLTDLALIYDAYDALLHVHGSDAAERLTLLADYISESTVGSTGHVFFDGFIDFTAQELTVIEELVRKGADITVCLTCDPDDDGEIFEIPNRTALQLRRLAEKHGVKVQQMNVQQRITAKQGDGSPTCPSRASNDEGDEVTVNQASNGEDDEVTVNRVNNNNDEGDAAAICRVSELVFLEKHLFDDDPQRYSDGKQEDHPPAHTTLPAPSAFSNECDAIKIYKAPSRFAECEHAAYEVLKHVRAAGYRWRDIGVMARNWEEYGSMCENIFEKYGIPYFSSGKADVLSKPPMTLIDAALETVTSGWEYKTIFRYFKSGLIEITPDQCAILENYVLKWQIRGSLWTREWTMPPNGYARAKDGDDMILKQINKTRQKLVGPLINLRDGIKGETNTETKLRALYSFLEEIKLAERLAKKAEEFNKRGEMRLADEYTQLWDITVNVIDQMYTIIGGDKLSAIEFRKLFTLALSQNDVGVIPVSLDRTPLGGMAMSRRRDLKCLIILGATDDNMPMLSKTGGALSDNERVQLQRLGTDIPAGLEERMYREMNMLYSTLTLPSDKLVVIYSTNKGSRPSFVVKRLSAMFNIQETDNNKMRMSCRGGNLPPALSHLTFLSVPVDNTREPSPCVPVPLSPQVAEQLYGETLSLSATRVDRFYSCPYKHFLQNGLRLEPRMPAEFDAMTAGNFAHYVLDGVFTEIKKSSGFKEIDEKKYLEFTHSYIEKYIHEVLLDFEGKNERFEYLFKRYRNDVVHVVRDMVEELRKSSFEPLELELNIGELTDTERGSIDRVDGSLIGDKLFLRVIDYKTRKKAYSFELADVLYGRDMQMLIYLFALEKYGYKRYGKAVEPAGVLYVPARDVIINAPRNATQEEIQKLRVGEMRRSGLVLNDPAVIEAMESGEAKDYLPVKTTKDGDIAGDSLVSMKQIELLSKHVSKMMNNAKERIQNGDTQCSPYYKSEIDNACTYCEYHSVCGFDEELGHKRRFIAKIKPKEAWEALEIT